MVKQALRQSKKRKVVEEDSVADSGSEVGWNSDDDIGFADKEYEEEDENFEGVLLSDLFNSKQGSSSKTKSETLQIESSRESRMETSDADSDSDTHSHSEGSVEQEGSLDAHSRLLKAIHRFAGSDRGEISVKSSVRNFPSENQMHNFSSGLSFETLMEDLNRSEGLHQAKEQLLVFDKSNNAPLVVEKVVAQRIERQQAYESSKSDINKWHDTVLLNRRTKTLNLANDKRKLSQSRTLISKFIPTTDLEKDISMVVMRNGLEEASLAQKELESLQGKNLSEEEISQRHAELAKINTLMFFEQMKRHRINKIKSKAYRSIQRKKKARLEENNIEDDEQAMEKHALERAKERSDLKHKNTSKWARMAQEHGHANKSLRDAYHESVRMGHELTNKMKEAENLSENEQFSENEENVESITDRTKSELASALQDLESSCVPQDGKYKKLFEMDFMKKATKNQRQKVMEEAAEALREISQLNNDYSGEEDIENHTRLPSNSKLSFYDVSNNKAASSLAKEQIGQLFSHVGHRSISADGSSGFELTSLARLGNGPSVRAPAMTSFSQQPTSDKPTENQVNPWVLEVTQSRRTRVKPGNKSDHQSFIEVPDLKPAVVNIEKLNVNGKVDDSSVQKENKGSAVRLLTDKPQVTKNYCALLCSLTLIGRTILFKWLSLAQMLKMISLPTSKV
jgi:U3 small nucleolar RNA-associated protein 14